MNVPWNITIELVVAKPAAGIIFECTNINKIYCFANVNICKIVRQRLYYSIYVYNLTKKFVLNFRCNRVGWWYWCVQAFMTNDIVYLSFYVRMELG